MNIGIIITNHQETRNKQKSIINDKNSNKKIFNHWSLEFVWLLFSCILYLDSKLVIRNF